MDVRQLAALVAIADHGTFSAAARALFTVQSNVSSHVARLEKELGTELVDRTHGGLTDDGLRVVERARRVLREVDEIAAELAQRDGDVVGDVRLGMLGTTARWLLPRLLSEMSARHPHVRVIVAEGSTSVLIPALLSGQYDAAIVHLPIDEPELNIEPLFAEDLLLLAGDGHPLADRSSIHLAELAGHRLLLPPPGSALRRVLDRAAVVRRRPARGRGRGRRRPPARHPRRRRPRRGDRPGDRRSRIVPATSPRCTSPSCRRGWSPSRLTADPARPEPTKALFDVLRDALPARALEQAGVRLGSDAFPLLRSTR